MKSIVMWLAMRGLINYGWFRTLGTWLVRKSGAWK
jgi:hypothetical protein